MVIITFKTLITNSKEQKLLELRSINQSLKTKNIAINNV